MILLIACPPSYFQASYKILCLETLEMDFQDSTIANQVPLKLGNPSYTAIAKAFLWADRRLPFWWSTHKKALAMAVYDGFPSFNGLAACWIWKFHVHCNGILYALGGPIQWWRNQHTTCWEAVGAAYQEKGTLTLQIHVPVANLTNTS